MMFVFGLLIGMIIWEIFWQRLNSKISDLHEEEIINLEQGVKERCAKWLEDNGPSDNKRNYDAANDLRRLRL